MDKANTETYLSIIKLKGCQSPDSIVRGVENLQPHLYRTTDAIIKSNQCHAKKYRTKTPRKKGIKQNQVFLQSMFMSERNLTRVTTLRFALFGSPMLIPNASVWSVSTFFSLN